MSGGEFRPTPYKIPGPAGIAPGQHQSPKGTPTASPQPTPPRNTARFTTTHWLSAIRLVQHPLRASVALVRSLALSRDVRKTPTLVVRLDSLVHVGKDASATLSDPTGDIVATFHNNVFLEHAEDIHVGAVIVLRDVVALAAFSRAATGFRSDAHTAVHMSVTAGNIKHVVSLRDGLSSSNAQEIPTPDQLLESYSTEAKHPVPPRKRPSNPRPRGLSDPPSSHNTRRAAPQHRQNPEQGRHAPPQKRPPSRLPHQQTRPSQRPRFAQEATNPSRAVVGTAQPGQLPGASNMPPPREVATRPSRPVPQQMLSKPVGVSAVTSVTDDMLDELLNDIDIDAAIAASGRQESQLPECDPPKSVPVPPVVESVENAEASLSGATRRAGLAEPPCIGNAAESSPPAVEVAVPAKSTADLASEVGPSLKGGTLAKAIPAAAEPGLRARVEAPDAVDDGVLAGLMDDLDGDDFTDF